MDRGGGFKRMVEGWSEDGCGEWKMVAGRGEPLEHWRDVERKSRVGKKVVGCYGTRGTG